MKTQEELTERNRLARKKLLDIVNRLSIIVDDVQYNQDWWSWYCKEHKLDINTGKEIKNYPIPPNFTLF